jgi:hypothetical protein
MSKQFEVGNVVRRSCGTKPAVVTNACHAFISCRYLDLSSTFDSYFTDLVLLADSEENFTMNQTDLVLLADSEENFTMNQMNSTTLYTFTDNGVDIYASVIGKTEAGLLVLEARGGGGIFTKSPSDVTEVVPHTVSIKFDGTSFHYEVPKDLLKVGDVLLRNDGKFGVVHQLDTKNRNANTKLSARRVLTEELEVNS